MPIVRFTKTMNVMKAHSQSFSSRKTKMLSNTLAIGIRIMKNTPRLRSSAGVRCPICAKRSRCHRSRGPGPQLNTLRNQASQDCRDRYGDSIPQDDIDKSVEMRPTNDARRWGLRRLG